MVCNVTSGGVQCEQGHDMIARIPFSPVCLVFPVTCYVRGKCVGMVCRYGCVGMGGNDSY